VEIQGGGLLTVLSSGQSSTNPKKNENWEHWKDVSQAPQAMRNLNLKRSRLYGETFTPELSTRLQCMDLSQALAPRQGWES
jgi:hypothetical protein